MTTPNLITIDANKIREVVLDFLLLDYTENNALQLYNKIMEHAIPQIDLPPTHNWLSEMENDTPIHGDVEMEQGEGELDKINDHFEGLNEPNEGRGFEC